MKNLRTALRMSIGLTSLAVSVLCLLHSFGSVPDSTAAMLKGRKAFCEAVAIYCSSAAVRGDQAMIETSTRKVLERNPDVLSATIRREDGTPLFQLGPPSPQPTDRGARPSPNQVLIPIFIGARPWGAVEIRFRSLSPVKGLVFLDSPTFRFIAQVSAGLFVTNFLYVLLVCGRNHRGASGIPERVRATLDTLVEGVLLMDMNQKIALVNSSFARTLGRSVEEVEGRTVEELAWAAPGGLENPSELPWNFAIEQGQPGLGAIIGLRTQVNGLRTFSVNSTPIVADDGTCHGALATFDDMTRIERKNLQLHKLLERLRRSRAEIRVQNRKLTDLATLDPLTSCLNRRAFFERFDLAWKAAHRHGQPLSCIMLDIDHFKSVNDRFGHSVGDQAIQVVSGVLKASLRAGDVVCRYGGEEFCVLLPQTGAGDAVTAAERFRQEIEASTFAGISVTASFGVSMLDSEIKGPHELIDRADQALYAAKHGGRNRVVPFDQIPETVLKAEPTATKPVEPVPPEREIPIPYHAVTSLVSALAHRDPATAEHSRRVADLCIQTAKGLISERDCYVLEIAALLHDIGKLGIPDSILKKPGPLTVEEWRVMKAHDGMGVEIITAAFASDDLREIVRTHHAWYGGNDRHPDLPFGPDIPLGARILSIADSYDAMISDRVYRKGRGREEAFVELRRCAGTQFEPDLVNRFIEVALARDESRRQPLSPLSKREALKIGLLIENLAEALDDKDLGQLNLMASRLGATATECRAGSIAAVTSKIEAAIAEKADWINLMVLTGDLLDLCRSTQASYLSAYTIDEFQVFPPEVRENGGGRALGAPADRFVGARSVGKGWGPQSLETAMSQQDGRQNPGTEEW